jgi:hypothetical protein
MTEIDTPDPLEVPDAPDDDTPEPEPQPDDTGDQPAETDPAAEPASGTEPG